MKIACVGGGPGGLFFATLVKRSLPGAEVTVFERNRADDTFGFGVVFSDRTLAAIDAADPVLREALQEHGTHWDRIEVRLKGERLGCGGNGMAAIERRVLLGLLQRRATDAGVDVRFSTPVDRYEQVADYDLVVASDGANSRFRTDAATRFEPTIETATAKFIWFGTTYRFEGLTFVHEHGPHGTFAVHGYPISPTVGTFIVETDEATWRRAGLDRFDVSQPTGPSDEGSKAYLAGLFAEQIGGADLLTNNSRWANFRTVGNRAWHAGDVVLLGDAAHTAHFSVGSGTKMAMEDAVALAAAVASSPDDLDAAMAAYEAERVPDVAAIQGSARPSLSWWEHFGRYHDAFDPVQFAFHFFTRSMAIERLRRRDAGFVADVEQWWKEQHDAPPLLTPLRAGDVIFAERTVGVVPPGHGTAEVGDVAGTTLPLRRGGANAPWGAWVEAPDHERDLPAALREVRVAAGAGASLVAVGGGSVLNRVLLCEESRLVGQVPSLLCAPGASAEDATTWVLSGRADLVATGTPRR